MSGSITFFPNKDTMVREQYFTNGTFTVPKGIFNLLIMACGGGGGGQSGNGDNDFSQSGQGGGGVIPHPIWVEVNPGDLITYTIGQGGTGGAAGVNWTNGNDGTPTIVVLANGNSIVFDGGRGGGRGSVTGFATAYGSHTKGGDRVYRYEGSKYKQYTAEAGQSSHFAAGGPAGIDSVGAEQGFDAGGGGGGAGYEMGGTGGNGRDLGLGRGGNPINGANGGIGAGGGGGGAEGAGDENGINSGAGGNGGPGMIVFMWSEHK